MDILSDVNVSGNLKVNNTLQVCGTVVFGEMDSCGNYEYGVYSPNGDISQMALNIYEVKSNSIRNNGLLTTGGISTNYLTGLTRYTEFEYLQTNYLQTNCLQTNFLLSNSTNLAFRTPQASLMGPLTYYLNRSVTVPQNCSKFFILQSFCTGGNNSSGQKLYPVIQSVSSDKTNFVDYEFSFEGSSNERISVIGSITPNADESTKFDFQLLFPTISPV